MKDVALSDNMDNIKEYSQYVDDYEQQIFDDFVTFMFSKSCIGFHLSID